MQIVVLPEVIEQKLKVEEKKQVIDFINDLVADTSNGLKKDIIEILEERFEKKLSVELVNLKMELSERITKVETQLNERITTSSEKLRAELVEKIAISKVDTIKWMFIFWLGNVITIIGGIIGILKIAKVF